MGSVALPRTGPLWAALAALIAAILLLPLLLVILAASMLGNGSDGATGPVADIPPEALALYRSAGEQYHLDWPILAAIGKIETDHCRSTMPGVHSGTNSARAAGCMQFLLSTWALPGIGEGGDPYTLEDSIPAAARYLRKSGAPEDYRRAIFAYNHADWYVDQVLAQAQEYRDAANPVPTGAVTGAPRQIIDAIVLPMSRACGVPRTVAENDAANARHGPTTSGGRSDHQGPPNEAWAADMSNGSSPTPQMDLLARRLAQRFAIPWHGSGLVTVTHGGYRFQLIYQTNEGGNHFNHVHFGVRLVA